MFDPKSKRVVVTRDVVFEEEKWEWNKSPVTGTGAGRNTLTAHYFTIKWVSTILVLVSAILA